MNKKAGKGGKQKKAKAAKKLTGEGKGSKKKGKPTKDYERAIRRAFSEARTRRAAAKEAEEDLEVLPESQLSQAL